MMASTSGITVAGTVIVREFMKKFASAPEEARPNTTSR